MDGKQRGTQRLYDAAFRCLSDKHRRRLLVSLLDRNPQQDDEHAVEEELIGVNDNVMLQLQFHHQHLPILDEVGFIEWDQDNHEVVKGPNFEEIRPLLELLITHQDELPDGWL